MKPSFVWNTRVQNALLSVTDKSIFETSSISVLEKDVGCVLWHINLCGLFNAKSC